MSEQTKKTFFLVLILFCASVISGCETTAGAAKGVAYGINSIAEGAAKDTYTTYSFLQRVDNWIKKNLW